MHTFPSCQTFFVSLDYLEAKIIFFLKNLLNEIIGVTKLIIDVLTVIIKFKIMSWYDQNKTTQWKIYLQNDYHIEHLLNHKDLIIQELPKVDELQSHLKINSHNIIQDCLELCLQYPNQISTYNRKYQYPTKAIELMTNELFFSNLAWNKQLIQMYIHRMFQCFSTVDSNAQNINLYHAYFERILKMLFVCRVVDKLDVIGALEYQQNTNNVLNYLYKHNHKLAIAFCLEMVLTVDIIEQLACFSLEFKKNIILNVYSHLDMFLRNNQDGQRTQNCLQILKGFLQKGINFLAAINCSTLPLSTLTSMKLDHFFQLYLILKANFNILTKIVLQTTQNSIKVSIFEILQLNQILLSQPQVKKRQITSQWCFKQSKQLIQHMLISRINITHPYFIDWLTISFSQIGMYQSQIQLIYSCKILQSIIKMMLESRQNNIIACKIYKLLKVIFHNIAEIYIIASIDKHKNNNINLINFDFLHYYLLNIKPIETAIKQFKTINDPLFATLFNLYKTISQYCQSIDSIFNLYIHIDICKNTKPLVASVILFQRNQPCFNVYQKEIIKDLGTFYTDDMFIDQKPLQFTVKPLKQIIQNNISTINQPLIDSQSIIQISATSSLPLQTIVLPQLNKEQTKQNKNDQQIKINLTSQPQITIKQSSLSSEKQLITYSKVNIDNQEQTGNKFSTFIKHQLKQININQEARRSKSRTPTKIKNQLKKAKNKWINSQQQPPIQNKKPYSSQMKERTTLSQQKIINLPKINLIKISKNKIPKTIRERQLCQVRDNRLLKWLIIRS